MARRFNVRYPDPHYASVDRKSTRLNSSHSQISYAVFCLKKKKTDEESDNAPPPGELHSYLRLMDAPRAHDAASILPNPPNLLIFHPTDVLEHPNPGLTLD